MGVWASIRGPNKGVVSDVLAGRDVVVPGELFGLVLEHRFDAVVAAVLCFRGCDPDIEGVQPVSSGASEDVGAPEGGIREQVRRLELDAWVASGRDFVYNPGHPIVPSGSFTL